MDNGWAVPGKQQTAEDFNYGRAKYWNMGQSTEQIRTNHRKGNRQKFGGGSYSQGQVISQSEYESYKSRRSEAMSAQAGGGSGDRRSARQERIAQIRTNINQQAKDRFTQLIGPKQKGKPRDFAGAMGSLKQTKVGKRAEALARKDVNQKVAQEAAMATGKGSRAKRRAELNEARRDPIAYADKSLAMAKQAKREINGSLNRSRKVARTALKKYRPL